MITAVSSVCWWSSTSGYHHGSGYPQQVLGTWGNGLDEGESAESWQDGGLIGGVWFSSRKRFYATIVVLTPNESVRSLGILLDPHLLLDGQVAGMACGVFHQLRQVAKRGLAMVTHALIMPRLDYYNMLYVELPLKTTWKWQMVQNAATYILLCKPCFCHSTPLLQKLHWDPVIFLSPI